MPMALEPVPFRTRLAQFATRLLLTVMVSAGLYAAGLSLAPYAGLFLLAVPLPGLIVASQAPMACGLWLTLTTSVLGLGLGPNAAAAFVLLFGIPACTVATGLRRGWSIEHTIVAATAAWSIAGASLALLACGDLSTLITTAREQLAHGFDLALSTYGSFGASETTVAAAAAERATMITALLEVLPAIVVLCGALMIIVNLVLLRSWTTAAHDVDLRLWRTPEALIWALIGTGFTMFLPWRPAGLLARNLFLVLLGCYFCQGLAIVSYFLERFRLPRGLRVAGYLLIAVQHVVAGIVLALGVFDLWGDFRRLSAGSANMQIPTDSE